MWCLQYALSMVLSAQCKDLSSVVHTGPYGFTRAYLKCSFSCVVIMAHVTVHVSGTVSFIVARFRCIVTVIRY